MNGNQTLSVVCGRAGRVFAVLLLAGMALLGPGAVAARAEDGPSIVKTRVIISVWQVWQTWIPATKKYLPDNTSWMPDMKFAINGPLAGGSQLSVDYTRPDGSAWVSIDCPTEEIKADHWTSVETPRDISTEFEKKYTNTVGLFGFKIRLKNELTGLNQVLYSGKFKVSRISRSLGIANRKNVCDYLVDYDWALPIGYIWLTEGNGDLQNLKVAMWFKYGINGSDLAGYVYYKGKQIASTKDRGSASTTEAAFQTVHDEKGDPRWDLCDLEWYMVSGSNSHPERTSPDVFSLDKNPGEYDIKVLRDGKLSREAKFTVGADGKIVDNGIVAANKMGTSRMLAPVQVLGTLDSPWQKSAWKTDGFFGNPLKEFVAP